MALEKTAFNDEIQRIFTNGEKAVHYMYEATLVVAGKDKHPVTKLLNRDIKRNYSTQYAEEIVVEVMLPGGTASHVIYPNKDNLRMTIKRIPIFEGNDRENLALKPTEQSYKAVLIGDGINAMANTDMVSKDVLDRGNLVRLSFQLVDPLLEKLRAETVGGIFRHSTVGAVIRTVLSGSSQRVSVDQSLQVKGVDLVDPSNTESVEHIVIPHGTSLVDVPGYIHKNCDGVYNSGFGYFLQDNMWYVYPEYDLTRFTKTPRTLTVLNIPENRMPGVERTWRTTANQLFLLATGQVKIKDIAEVSQLNLGNGVRFTDATKIVNDFGKSVKGKLTVGRGGLNNEFIAEARKDGLKNAAMSAARITANSYLEMSKLAARQGSYVSLVWEHADISKLYPGQPTRLLYLQNGIVEEVFGVLLGVHELTAMDGTGLTSRRYRNNAMLTLFVSHHINLDARQSESTLGA